MAEEQETEDETQEEDEKMPGWEPNTKLGRRVKNGEFDNLDEILDKGMMILEPEIVDYLLNTEDELLLIGQSKGKFGGGQRRVFKQTQKKTREGNKPQFTAMAVLGDRDGHIGIGLGKAKETVPARDKGIRMAKKNIFKIRRGCGSWQCDCGGHHSIPFEVTGRCGSVRITLKPAPRGKGLVTESEVQKTLELAGIQDVWSKSFGHTENKINLIKALEDALRKLMLTKLHAKPAQEIEVYEGSVEDGGR